MSGEIVQPHQEATANSNGVSKLLPNSHQDLADKSNLDLSASGNSPVASTYLNSASTTAQASPSQEVPDVSNYYQEPTTRITPDQTIVTQQDNLGSGTAFPSNSLTYPEGAQAGGSLPEEQGKVSKRASKGSIKESSRRGSTASSKLSRKEKAVVPAASSQVKEGEPDLSTNAEKPRKKGFSRFFSALNCCRPSKDANASESQQAVPSKKAKTLQANRGRQTTPITKPNASAEESSKTESKEAVEDNIAGPPYSELTPAAKPKIIEPTKKQTPIMEKLPIASDNGPSAEPKPIPTQPTPSDQPLPPLTPTSNNTTPNVYDVSNEKSIAPGADGPAESPPPTSTVVAGEGMSKEESTINDRTSQQEARDVEMHDAPPVPSASEQPATHHEVPAPTLPPTPLPPPPPPPPIPSPSRPGSSDRQASNGATTGDQQKWLLPPVADRFRGKKCLVLDLDETLVHSSFKILHQADFTIPVEIEGQYHNVYVIKRPGVDQFMKRVGELYEVVVFTASVSKYGDPLLDQLDIHNVVHHRLFRESCYNHQGNYVKDLSQVGRDLRETIIIDNSPTSYIFHPQHAVPISSWFSDAHDNELLDLIPVLEDLAGSQVRDVSLVLDVGL
ncbi:MAG: hypothetical protein Q9208_004112 [Pyrenodesmia sp. 3 TL-2023]